MQIIKTQRRKDTELLMHLCVFVFNKLISYYWASLKIANCQTIKPKERGHVQLRTYSADLRGQYPTLRNRVVLNRSPQCQCFFLDASLYIYFFVALRLLAFLRFLGLGVAKRTLSLSKTNAISSSVISEVIPR